MVRVELLRDVQVHLPRHAHTLVPRAGTRRVSGAKGVTRRVSGGQGGREGIRVGAKGARAGVACQQTQRSTRQRAYGVSAVASKRERQRAVAVLL